MGGQGAEEFAQGELPGTGEGGSSPRVEVVGRRVRIVEVTLERPVVASYLSGLTDEARVEAVRSALEIGVLSLERASQSQDMSFVREHIQGLLTEVQGRVSGIPLQLQEDLAQRIGTGQGQVLEPLMVAVQVATTASQDRLTEIRRLLSEDMDPGNERGKLGLALRELKDLLDAKRSDSIQGRLGESLRTVTAPDGEMARTVREMVRQAMEPLTTSVKSLEVAVLQKASADAAQEGTTLQGATYEEEVLVAVRRWAKVSGAHVTHVGPDNRPGDVLVEIPRTSGLDALRIIVEAKNETTRRGRKPVSESVRHALLQREAGAAVYLSRTEEGLASEIGEWSEGEDERGPWVATIDPYLATALRFVIVMARLRALQAAGEASTLHLGPQIANVRTALKRLAQIKTQVTAAQAALGSVGDHADELRNEVERALKAMEEAQSRASSASGGGLSKSA